MKVLLTHRFFWPDTAPYARMLRSIGDTLAEAGHQVHVLSSRPSYRDGETATTPTGTEQLGALKVRRIWVFTREKSNPLRRIANIVIYCFALFREVLRLRPDVVTASTFPPVVAAWTTSLAARMVGARFIYHMQDIHPEVSFYSGGRLGRGLPARILRWLDNQTLQRADTIVTLSEDMANTLRARGLGDLPIHLINNPSLDDPSLDDPSLDSAAADGPPTALRKPPGKRRIIFAGNLGRFQNLPLLAEGVATCFAQNPDLELLFLGDGAALPDLKQTWGDHPQVRFAPFLPFAQARDLIADSDVGLVALTPNIYRVAYPSKIATYLSLGLHVLALVEPDSHIARDLEAAGQGSAPADPSPEAIGQALTQVLAMPAYQSDPAKELAATYAAWSGLIDRESGDQG